MSTFADRFAYLRWRWAAGAIKSTDAEFAQWLGVSDAWYSKWKTRAASPPGRVEWKAIGDRLGRDVADWLYDGTGSAPEPDLWARWTAPASRVAEVAKPYHGTTPKQEKPVRGAKKAPRKKAG